MNQAQKSMDIALISKMIKAKRLEKQITPAVAAKEVGISTNSLRRYENEEMTSFRQNYYRICKWLGVPNDYFLNPNKGPKEEKKPVTDNLYEITSILTNDTTLTPSMKMSLIEIIKCAYSAI